MLLFGSEISKTRVSAETVSMLKVDNTRPLPERISILSISVKQNFVLAPSTHHEVQQGRQCAGQLTIVRHGAYLEYTQNIVLQHQGEDPTGNPTTPYLQHLSYSSVSLGTPKRGTTSRLTGTSSLPPPVYSEAWAKGIPRTQFPFLRDAAHGKHVG
ncbi:hypothetical protein TNCV_856091 [Trichonephila clavipes]|nr:hypothetical protein TNCV_856091 [Trichonephila clavipes]